MRAGRAAHDPTTRRARQLGCLGVLAWLWTSGIGCGPSGLPAAARAPDVLLVVLDTVRADRSSSYGYPRSTTIQLDMLAEAGVLFEDVTAPGPWTLPSHASLFTGEGPWVHGAHSVSSGPASTELFGMHVSAMRPDLPTLAEKFAGAGYHCVSLVANDWLGPELGLSRGFHDARVLKSDAEVVRAALAEIDTPRDQPRFLFLNLMSAHAPYYEGPGKWGSSTPDWLRAASAPGWLQPYLVTEGVDERGEPLRRGVQFSRNGSGDDASGVLRYAQGDLAISPTDFAWLAELYDAGVRAADFGFGRVLERWVTVAPQGIVALTSDHGEAFGEHGLLEHRGSVYPEMLQVPLVIAAPGRLPANTRIREPAAMHELHPTLLELAGVEAEPEGSLVALAKGGARDTPIAAAAWPVASWAQRAGGRHAETWRLYREGDAALVWGSGGSFQLYDLGEDAGMRRDLAAARPEQARRLQQAATAYFAQKPIAEPRPVEISDDLRERLSALGYATGGEGR